MVMVAPVIPAVTDSELENILEAAKDAGALAAGYVMLRLPWEVKDLFEDWLRTHQPGKAAHVMSLMRQMHGRDPKLTIEENAPSVAAEDETQILEPDLATPLPTPYRKNEHYSSQWGVRQRGSGQLAQMIEQRFRLAVKRLGLDRWRDLKLDTTRFKVPPAAGDQMTLTL
jgi:DNA repair photolyase